MTDFLAFVGDLLFEVLCLALYIGVGIAFAHTLSKVVYREKQRRYAGSGTLKEINQKVARDYGLSLAGWIFLWPVRSFSFLVRTLILHILVLPVQGLVSWAADVAKAPVVAQLKVIQDTEEEIAGLTKTIRGDQTSDEDRVIAESGLKDVYRKQEAACGDLGIKPPERLALTAGAMSQDVLDRATQIAAEVLHPRSASVKPKPMPPKQRYVGKGRYMDVRQEGQPFPYPLYEQTREHWGD